MEEDRIMPFGKYKGQLVITLIKENPKYINWVANNTSFALYDDEKKLLSQKLACMANRRIKHYRFSNSQTALEAFGRFLDNKVLGCNYSEDYFDDHFSSVEKEVRSSIQYPREREEAYAKLLNEGLENPSYDDMLPGLEYW